MTEIETATARFRVRRTSHGWGDDIAQPCLEAYRGTFTGHVYCTLPLAKAMTSPNTEWFRKLVNHRPAPGGRSVADRPDQPCWFVDIAGLDGLLDFISRHGMVVVNRESDGVWIEIYDGYRE